MKHFLSLYLFLFPLLLQSQNIVINELQSRNINTLSENCSRGNCPDWIELYNASSSTIDIGGYFLSDDKDNLTKWQIPAGESLGPNSYLIIFTEGANIRSFSSSAPTYKTNFNLSDGETLSLLDSTETLIQQLTLPVIQNDFSFGRLRDGSYSILHNPSPRAANLDSAAHRPLESELNISVPSGVYPSDLTIELSHTGAGTIFYTLDGTTPNTSSIPYSGAITITENTVLKAIVIENRNSFSLVENRSYIIGASHDLPIVLLTSDNSSRNSRNNEIINGRVEFNFIETDGTTVINQYANFRTSGKTSASFPQLNGKVEADKKLYGDGDFDYKMYPNKNIDKFDSFLFRNASQDWANTHLRDAFISRLLGKNNLTETPFEGYRPAVLYVNAKYQGIINVREDDDGDYVKHNFGLKSGEFQTKLGQGVFINFRDLDFNLREDREEFSKRVNFKEHLSLKLLFAYATPGEWGWQQWEDLSGKTGTQFHYNFHDFDPIYGLAFDGANFTNIKDTPMKVNDFMESNIRAYEPFKNEAIQFIAASINHIFNTTRSIEILNEMQSELENEIPAHAIAMNQLARETSYSFKPKNEIPFANSSQWEKNLEDLKTNISNIMDDAIFNRIQSEYSLDTPITVNYSSSNINQGFVRVHDVKIIRENASGTYFSNIPLKLSAEAFPGFRFVRWEGDVDATTAEIAPIFNTIASVTAVFEPVTITLNTIVINEVQSKNDTTIADENGEFDDWIEIYNPSSDPVNLAGFYISDNLSEPLKWQIPDTDPTKTTVPANGYLLLWADNNLDQGENHLGFKLKGKDQVILTYPDGTTEKQRLEFDIDSDQSFGAETDADSNYIVFKNPTPNASNTGSVLSIEDLRLSKLNPFSVYPNPTTSKATISTSAKNLKTPLVWKIYSMAGSTVAFGKGNSVDMRNLAKGLYFITINNSKTIKVIRE